MFHPVSFSPRFNVCLCRDLLRTSEEQGCPGWACCAALRRVWGWPTPPTDAGRCQSRAPLGAHRRVMEAEQTACGTEAFCSMEQHLPKISGPAVPNQMSTMLCASLSFTATVSHISRQCWWYVTYTSWVKDSCFNFIRDCFQNVFGHLGVCKHVDWWESFESTSGFLPGAI